MREICFRAKCKLKSKWMYGYYRVSGGKHYINSTEVYPETVGQFTGLKDKNGVDIYEGDIVKETFETFDNQLWKVLFDKKEAMFLVETLTHKTTLVLLSDVINGEVIGNIHDNPELMEVER